MRACERARKDDDDATFEKTVFELRTGGGVASLRGAFFFAGLVVALAGATGCTDQAEDIGAVTQTVSSVGSEHDIIVGDFPIQTLSTVWIPFASSSGRIVAAYTGGEGPKAKYAFTDPQSWISGTTGQTQAGWDDAPAWPAPSNFCEVYTGCASGNSVFIGYVGAAVALTTDHLNTAAIVALSAYPNQDDQIISAAAVPTAMEGTTLGLTVQAICVHDDYGPCTSGGPRTKQESPALWIWGGSCTSSRLRAASIARPRVTAGRRVSSLRCKSDRARGGVGFDHRLIRRRRFARRRGSSG